MRKIALLISFGLGLVLTLFSLLSVSESFGSGVMAILKNSPNALPWLLYIFLIALASRWSRAGSALLLIYTAGLVYLFNFSGPNFFVATFLLTLVIFALAAVISYVSLLRKAS